MAPPGRQDQEMAFFNSLPGSSTGFGSPSDKLYTEVLTKHEAESEYSVFVRTPGAGQVEGSPCSLLSGGIGAQLSESLPATNALVW